MDFAVLTVPLGVLQHGDIIFSPSIPSHQSDALNRMGYMDWLKACILSLLRLAWQSCSSGCTLV